MFYSRFIMSDSREPIISNRVVPRWQRKEMERRNKITTSNTSFSSLSNVSSTIGESFSGITVSGPSEARRTPCKPSLTLNMPYKTTNPDGTPKKKLGTSLKCQNKVGTPKKMLSKSREGKRSAHTTPSCDRFIPPRSGNNFDSSGFDMLNKEDENLDSPTTRRYSRSTTNISQFQGFSNSKLAT